MLMIYGGMESSNKIGVHKKLLGFAEKLINNLDKFIDIRVILSIFVLRRGYGKKFSKTVLKLIIQNLYNINISFFFKISNLLLSHTFNNLTKKTESNNE